jgi:hypothetical protein
MNIADGKRHLYRVDHRESQDLDEGRLFWADNAKFAVSDPNDQLTSNMGQLLNY